jgi:hypothetical protein
VSKAAAKGAVLVGCGSPKKTVIYFPWAMKLAQFWCSKLSFPRFPTTKASTILFLYGYGKEVPLRTIHIYRAARDYFVDGIYWGDDEEGVRFYLDVTGVPPGQITKALEQVAQEGTAIIYHKASTRLFTEVG